MLVRFRKQGEGWIWGGGVGGGGCWSLDSVVAMSTTTLNRPNNTEHICFTIAQTFFSLYFPCLIVKVPDGAESRLRWEKKRKRKEKRQTWKVRRALPAPLQDNKPLTPVASGVMFQGISGAFGNLLQSGWFDVCDWDVALSGDDKFAPLSVIVAINDKDAALTFCSRHPPLLCRADGSSHARVLASIIPLAAA